MFNTDILCYVFFLFPSNFLYDELMVTVDKWLVFVVRSHTRRSRKQEDFYYWWGVEKVKEKVTEKWSRYSLFFRRFILYNNNNLFLIGLSRQSSNTLFKEKSIDLTERCLFARFFSDGGRVIHTDVGAENSSKIMRQTKISTGYRYIPHWNDLMRIRLSEWMRYSICMLHAPRDRSVASIYMSPMYCHSIDQSSHLQPCLLSKHEY